MNKIEQFISSWSLYSGRANKQKLYKYNIILIVINAVKKCRPE